MKEISLLEQEQSHSYVQTTNENLNQKRVSTFETKLTHVFMTSVQVRTEHVFLPMDYLHKPLTLFLLLMNILPPPTSWANKVKGQLFSHLHT